MAAVMIWAGVRLMKGKPLDEPEDYALRDEHAADALDTQSEPIYERDKITYYTINHPSWERSRMANHDCWSKGESKIIGTWENAWIQLPKSNDPNVEFYAEIFEQDGENFMVKLNDEPLSSSARLEWQNLNPEPLGEMFHVGEFEIYRKNCHENDLPMTIIGPNIEGEHILKDQGGYPNSIGSGEACGIRLPDPKLPEYMGEIVPHSNHRMLYALDGKPSTGLRPPEGEFITRVDLHHFEFAGYLIFQRRNPNDSFQKQSVIWFREEQVTSR